jgi:uncharacterized protein (DUF2384 family)
MGGRGEVAQKHSPALEMDSSESRRADVRRTYENYRELVDRVGDAFGDAIKASIWLSTPSVDFDNRTPLEVAREKDYRVASLEPFLIRMEHGVFY